MNQLAIEVVRSWTLEFWVSGMPVPQGSKTARVIGERTTIYGQTAVINPRAIVTEQSDMRGKTKRSGSLRRWRDLIGTMACIAMKRDGLALCHSPVLLSCEFFFARPKSHFLRSGRLTKRAPLRPGKPDLSKLIRAVEDALTGIAWRDDAQVAMYHLCSKEYVDRDPGCHVRIEVLS